MRNAIERVWQRWSRQERIFVAALAVCSALVILIFGVIGPALDFRGQAKTRLEAARLTQAMVEQVGGPGRSAAGGQAQGRGQPVGATDLRAIVIELAASRGLSISRVEPGEGGRLDVIFDQVSAPGLFAWVDACLDAGLPEPDRISLRASEVPGQVSASISFPAGTAS